jgi:hypothetical protein
MYLALPNRTSRGFFTSAIVAAFGAFVGFSLGIVLEYGRTGETMMSALSLTLLAISGDVLPPLSSSYRGVALGIFITMSCWIFATRLGRRGRIALALGVSLAVGSFGVGALLARLTIPG